MSFLGMKQKDFSASAVPECRSPDGATATTPAPDGRRPGAWVRDAEAAHQLSSAQLAGEFPFDQFAESRAVNSACMVADSIAVVFHRFPWHSIRQLRLNKVRRRRSGSLSPVR